MSYDDAFRGAGRFTIDLNKGVKTLTPVFELNYGKFIDHEISMSLRIPKQTIILRSVKVLLDSAESAQKMRSLGFIFPFLSYNHLVDNSPNRLAFTFPLNSESKLTYEHALEKPLYMFKDAELKFQISIYDADGNPADGINCVYLDFETEIGSVG